MVEIARAALSVLFWPIVFELQLDVKYGCTCTLTEDCTIVDVHNTWLLLMFFSPQLDVEKALLCSDCSVGWLSNGSPDVFPLSQVLLPLLRNSQLNGISPVVLGLPHLLNISTGGILIRCHNSFQRAAVQLWAPSKSINSNRSPKRGICCWISTADFDPRIFFTLFPPSVLAVSRPTSCCVGLSPLPP